MSENFTLDSARLASIAGQLAEGYPKAVPFPHAVIDGLFPDDVLRTVKASFPEKHEDTWHRFDNPRQRKLASIDPSVLNPTVIQFLYQLNSASFVNFVESLTGIDGLVPDPYFEGGGLHQIERGGFLKIHADFNRHPKLRLDRRINLLLYLNENWKDEYGGHLEFWNRDMTRCVQRIAPVFNRCVIFSTTDHSYHGHPEPLTCPPEITRQSLALYYYSNGRPEEEQSIEHGTLVKPRPGETIHGLNGRTPVGTLKSIARRLIPGKQKQ